MNDATMIVVTDPATAYMWTNYPNACMIFQGIFGLIVFCFVIFVFVKVLKGFSKF
jgi:hypothetical protein